MLFFVTSVKESAVTYRVIQVRLQQILPQPRRGLVGHLHPILQDSHRELRRGVTGQPQAEVRVRRLWGKLLAGFFQWCHPGDG